MLSVTNKALMLIVVLLSVIMLNVVMLSVMAPFDQLLGNSATPSVQTEQSKHKRQSIEIQKTKQKIDSWIKYQENNRL